MKYKTILSVAAMAIGATAQIGSDTSHCNTSGASPSVKDARALAKKMKQEPKGVQVCVPKDIAHQDNCVHLKYNTGTASASYCDTSGGRCTFDPSGPACTGAGCGYPVGLAGDDLDMLIDKCKHNGKVGGIYTTGKSPNGALKIKLFHS